MWHTRKASSTREHAGCPADPRPDGISGRKSTRADMGPVARDSISKSQTNEQQKKEEGVVGHLSVTERADIPVAPSSSSRSKLHRQRSSPICVQRGRWLATNKTPTKTKRSSPMASRGHLGEKWRTSGNTHHSNIGVNGSCRPGTTVLKTKMRWSSPTSVRAYIETPARSKDTRSLVHRLLA
jgi:hypothetical protein